MKRILQLLCVFLPTASFGAGTVSLNQGSGGGTLTIIGGTSGGGGSTSPGGAPSNVQYNSAGSFAGDTGFQYDSTVSSVTINAVGTNALSIGSQTSGAGSAVWINLLTGTGSRGTFGFDSTNNYYGFRDSSNNRMFGGTRAFFPDRTYFSIYNVSGANYVGFRSSDTTDTQNYVLPKSTGSVGQVLTVGAIIPATGGNEGLETLLWQTPTGGSSGYALEPATAPAVGFTNGFYTSTIAITSDSPGVAHVIAGSSQVVTGLVLSTEVASNLRRSGLTMSFDGAGSALTTSTRSVTLPFDFTLSTWTITCSSGSVAIHVSSGSVSDYKLGNYYNISAAGNSPSVTSNVYNGAQLSGWGQTTFSAGDVISFVLDTATTSTWAIIEIWGLR